MITFKNCCQINNEIISHSKESVDVTTKVKRKSIRKKLSPSRREGSDEDQAVAASTTATTTTKSGTLTKKKKKRKSTSATNINEEEGVAVDEANYDNESGPSREFFLFERTS